MVHHFIPHIGNGADISYNNFYIDIDTSMLSLQDTITGITVANPVILSVSIAQQMTWYPDRTRTTPRPGARKACNPCVMLINRQITRLVTDGI